ncbi:uncharacterized [Tachysurus ichikawai]
MCADRQPVCVLLGSVSLGMLERPPAPWACRAAVRSGAAVLAWLFLESGATLSPASAVFEGTSAPLIRLGTPRCERAPGPGSPHCTFLFLSLHSLHSVKHRGTSSISPVRNVNRRFNQTFRLLNPTTTTTS